MIFTIVIISLFCNGLKIITEEGMIFHPFEVWASKLPNIIYKPLIGCLGCMGSVWGIAIYIALNGFSLIQIPYIIICCVCAAFTNFLFKDILDAVGR